MQIPGCAIPIHVVTSSVRRHIASATYDTTTAAALMVAAEMTVKIATFMTETSADASCTAVLTGVQFGRTSRTRTIRVVRANALAYPRLWIGTRSRFARTTATDP